MTDLEAEPFRTEPFVREKVWGGRKLSDAFGKSAPPDTPVGETWEVADLAEGQCHAATGKHRGTPLGELVESWGDALIGREAPTEGEFPLLVKLIDAAEDLSVQVHPSEQDVRDHYPTADSKDECWIVVDAAPDGAILHGVQEGVDADAFRRAVDDERATDLLRRVPVEAGDVIRVPAGTIHAICAGVTLLEIQQPSDTTYRVYDYGRTGLDGEPRELHLDRAMTVANFGPQPPTSLSGEPTDFDGTSVERLVDAGAYRIERADMISDVEWRVAPSSPQVLHVMEGNLELRANEMDPVKVAPHQTVVVPAATGRVSARATETARVIVAGLGGAPLLA